MLKTFWLTLLMSLLAIGASTLCYSKIVISDTLAASPEVYPDPLDPDAPGDLVKVMNDFSVELSPDGLELLARNHEIARTLALKDRRLTVPLAKYSIIRKHENILLNHKRLISMDILQRSEKRRTVPH